MKDRLFKLFSLAFFSACAVAAFLLIDKKDIYIFLNFSYSYFVIPVLFGLWLFFFCRVHAPFWKILVFALSYAVWFILSYVLWFWVGLACYTDSSYDLSPFFLYLLFIAENLVVKKLFRLSFKTPLRLFLFLFFHPIFIAFWSFVALFLQMIFFGYDIWLPSYFDSGSIIFGYMMTEGFIFVFGTEKERQ